MRKSYALSIVRQTSELLRDYVEPTVRKKVLLSLLVLKFLEKEVDLPLEVKWSEIIFRNDYHLKDLILRAFYTIIE